MHAVPFDGAVRFQTNPNPHTMQIFTGPCYGTGTIPVVGRVLFPSSGTLPAASGACLPVIHRLPVTELQEESDVVGFVWCGELPPKDEELCALPCPLIVLPELPPYCHGKIALLDPACGSLFVSPDLKTVNRYTHRLTPDSVRLREEPPILPDGTRLRISAKTTAFSLVSPAEPDGRLIDPEDFSPPSIDAEDFLYELYRDVAERTTGLPITVLVDIDRQTPNGAFLRERVRALFRGAVYGNFSLLFRGVATEVDLRRALGQIHEIFCELESEGREFNGYIPKGVLLDTPLSLMGELPHDGMDFLCADLPRLTELLCGHTPCDLSREAAIRKLLVDCFTRFHGLRKTLLTDSLPLSDPLLPLLTECGITELFLPPDQIASARQRLRALFCEQNIFP